MKAAKVIVAAVLIFGAGALCGFWASSWRGGPKGWPGGLWTPPPLQRVELLRKAAREIGLDKAQLDRIDAAAASTRRRLQDLLRPVGPVAREELSLLQSRVLAELTPDQKKRFDEWLARFRDRAKEARRAAGLAAGSNAPVTPPASP